jgi:pyridinium-3,5-biscarboxylic acid mononucleotide synthase
MTADRVLELLESVAAGVSTPAQALEKLAWLPVESVTAVEADAAFARLDHHRGVRVGFPEVVYGPGKTPEQVTAICERLSERDGGFLVTRVNEVQAEALQARFPKTVNNRRGRIAWLEPPGFEVDPRRGVIVVASAGTADLPVAEEAAVAAHALGNPVERVFDVGVAGLHRLMASSETLRRGSVIIAVAGMDGAMPSVIGGLVGAPVIAVPTSTGYGASFGGVAALLTMLNSCAAGVTVVNIDNGFGAACAATRINREVARVSPR